MKLTSLIYRHTPPTEIRGKIVATDAKRLEFGLEEGELDLAGFTFTVKGGVVVAVSVLGERLEAVYLRGEAECLEARAQRHRKALEIIESLEYPT